MTVTCSISSDEEDEIPDQSVVDFDPTLAMRRLPKAPIQARLRQSRRGRQRAKEGPSTKCQGRVHLSEYSMSATKYVRSAASGKTMVPAYSLMIVHKVLAKSISNKMEATTVLLDTGASVSLMLAWQAKALKVEVTPRSDIIIRGADGRRLAVDGTGEVWVRDPMATYWKKVKVVITKEGSWTLISLKD